MRLILELLVAAALVVTAWERPYHEWAGEAIPSLAPASAPADPSITRPSLPAAKMSSDGAWMWEKNRRTALDRPAYNNSNGSEGDRTFTGHVYYKDEAGNTYWIDGAGKRHYGD